MIIYLYTFKMIRIILYFCVCCFFTIFNKETNYRIYNHRNCKKNVILWMVIRARDSEKETERRESCVNNLHSDESIVLRRAHATAPIMALRLTKVSTELLHSHPFEAGYSTNRLHPSGAIVRPSATHSFLPVLSRSLAHFSTDIARVPFHSEKFNYNRNYHSKKVLLANARHLTIATISSFAMVGN